MLVRLLVGYAAADLSLPGVFLVGLVAGRAAGVLGGTLVALPALVAGEFLSLPAGVVCGLVGGELCARSPRGKPLPDIHPLFPLQVGRAARDRLEGEAVEWEILPIALCALLEALRLVVSRLAGPKLLFALESPSPAVNLLIVFATVCCLGIPLKIWNNTLVGRTLVEKEEHLSRFRLELLRNQINPHFLFNTLNSINASIRLDPERARRMIVQLSSILRDLLRSGEEFRSLAKEVEFLDSYLALETARLGPHKLKIEKSLTPASLSTFVPSMILQPLVENAVRHGIAPLPEGGTLRISAFLDNRRLYVEIADDGAGLAPGSEKARPSSGIGLANVRERLSVLYGEDFEMRIEGAPGAGTRVRLVIPETSVEKGRTP